MAMHDSFSPGRADFTRDALPGFKEPDTAQDAQTAPRFIEDRPAPVDHAVGADATPSEEDFLAGREQLRTAPVSPQRPATRDIDGVMARAGYVPNPAPCCPECGGDGLDDEAGPCQRCIAKGRAT